MYKIKFIYQSIDCIVQCSKKEKFKDIYERCKSENKLKIEEPFFLYNGTIVDKEKAFEDIASLEDKNRKLMNVLIEPVNKSIIAEKKIKSKEIICPKCSENCLLNIKNYKFNVFGCKNKHKINDILINKFEETQKIDISNVLCSICKKSRSKTFNNQFFMCGTCNSNLCPLCKTIHNKEGHNIFSYEDKFYKAINIVFFIQFIAILVT